MWGVRLTVLRVVPVVWALAVVFAASPVASHGGYGGGAIDARGILEGEDYDTSATTACDPTTDSEHTDVRLSSDRSGGAYAFIPHNGCYIDFQAVSFPRVGHFTEITMSATGSNSVLTFRTDVFVGGVLSSTATYTVTGGDPWQQVLLDPVSVVPVGVHAVRVQNTIVSGAAWHNFNLDCLKFDPPDDKPCLIQEPVAAFEAEGGCAGEERTFLDQSTPPTGASLVRSRWNFGDGTTAVVDPWAPSVTHTYTAPGIYGVALIVEDSAGGMGSATDRVQIVDCTPRPLPIAPPSGNEPDWYHWPDRPFGPAAPPTVSLQDPVQQVWLDTDAGGTQQGPAQAGGTPQEVCLFPPCLSPCACPDDVAGGAPAAKGERTWAEPLAREVASAPPPPPASQGTGLQVLLGTGLAVLLVVLAVARRPRGRDQVADGRPPD